MNKNLKWSTYNPITINKYNSSVIMNKEKHKENVYKHLYQKEYHIMDNSIKEKNMEKDY